MQAIKADLVWFDGNLQKNITILVEDGKINKIFKNEKEFDDFKQNNSCKTILLKNSALFPGMINCHSHAFQRGLRGKGEVFPKENANNTFWTWREEMYSLVDSLDENSFYELTKAAFDEMVASGITSVGEFHYFHHSKGKNTGFEFDRIVLKAAQDSGIRIVLLNTFYARGGFDVPLSNSQKRFETNNLATYFDNISALKKIAGKTQTIGIAAHSVRAVSLQDIKELHKYSQKENLVFHIHLEEQMKEIEDCQQSTGKRPIELLMENLNLDNKTTAVHCTQTPDHFLHEFVKKGANICICPLTEANLGDGIVDLKACNGEVCLGTDCNARICFAEEMRGLEYAQRLKTKKRGVSIEGLATEYLSKELFRYATEVGARSLGLKAGKIEEGYEADFFALNLESPTLKLSNQDRILDSFIFGSSGEASVIATCVGGKWIFKKEFPVVSTESKESIASKDLITSPVVKLAQDLIDISSISGDEGAMSDFVEKYLKARGWHVFRQQVKDSKRYNILATLTEFKPKTKGPRLLFNSHLDTVPPFFPSRIDGSIIRGRGACDTKSLIASQLIAAQKLVEKGIKDIGLLYVVGEEVDHIGMIVANDLGLDPEFLIVGEPTRSKIAKLQKGILKLNLFSKGIAAHSGYPELGKSAVESLLDVLQDLRGEKWPVSEIFGATTMNIGIIKGGVASNVVPENAEANVMFRVISDPSEILKRVKELVKERVEVQVMTMNPPVQLNELEGFESDTVSFNTDIPYFKFSGKAFLYGPGSITDAHIANEYIKIEDLEKSVEIYQRMAEKLLA